MMIRRTAHLLASGRHCLGRLAELLLGPLRSSPECIGSDARLLPRNLARRELGAHGVQLGATSEWAGAAALTWKPDGPSRIDERAALLECLHTPEQGADPVASSG